MSDRQEYFRRYHATHPDPRYGTPEYQARITARLRRLRADPMFRVREVARRTGRRRVAAIARMREELYGS